MGTIIKSVKGLKLELHNNKKLRKEYLKGLWALLKKHGLSLDKDLRAGIEADVPGDSSKRYP